MSDEPALDSKEALIHIRTLARVGERSDDTNEMRRHFKMILTLVEIVLPSRQQ